MAVYNLKNEPLGKVKNFISSGGNDILVIRGKEEHLVPFVMEHIVKTVDLKAQKIYIDWDMSPL